MDTACNHIWTQAQFTELGGKVDAQVETDTYIDRLQIDSLVARARDVKDYDRTPQYINHTHINIHITYRSQVEKQAAGMAKLGNKLDQLLLGEHEQARIPIAISI